MKYTYAYKTSDGARHEAAMEAESRDAVFAALRAKGIKAIKVVAADGSKANGEVRPAKTAIIIGWSTTVASKRSKQKLKNSLFLLLRRLMNNQKNSRFRQKKPR